MNKYILIIGLLMFVPIISAHNISEISGGENLITPVIYKYDNHFALVNEDTIDYSIYMYNYIGLNNYTTGFIGIIQPGETIILNNNASYYIYTAYPDWDNLQSEDIIKKRINQYWLILIILIIIIIGIYTAIRVVIK